MNQEKGFKKSEIASLEKAEFLLSICLGLFKTRLDLTEMEIDENAIQFEPVSNVSPSYAILEIQNEMLKQHLEKRDERLLISLKTTVEVIDSTVNRLESIAMKILGVADKYVLSHNLRNELLESVDSIIKYQSNLSKIKDIIQEDI